MRKTTNKFCGFTRFLNKTKNKKQKEKLKKVKQGLGGYLNSRESKLHLLRRGQNLGNFKGIREWFCMRHVTFAISCLHSWLLALVMADMASLLWMSQEGVNERFVVWRDLKRVFKGLTIWSFKVSFSPFLFSDRNESLEMANGLVLELDRRKTDAKTWRTTNKSIKKNNVQYFLRPWNREHILLLNKAIPLVANHCCPFLDSLKT